MRRRPSRVIRPVTAAVTALATAIAYAGISMPTAQAAPADPDVAAITALVAQVAGLMPGVSGAGALGQALPTLDVSPGGPGGVGVATLLAEALTKTDLATATSFGDLVGAVNGKSGSISTGRTVTWTGSTASNGSVESLTVGLHAARAAAPARLDVRDPAGDVNLASTGGVTVDLTADLGLTVNYDTTTHAAWLTRTGSTPSLSVGFSVNLHPDQIKAGLGILGVQVVAGSTFHLDGGVTTSWSDPNNDGRLAFDEPGNGPDDGELAAAGAGAGLVTAQFTGSLDATLNVAATQTALLPIAATATVHVAQPDLTNGAPTVTATLSDNIRPFLTLSPRDLAQGLAQAASAVLALQSSTGVKLPFMRGDVADAVASVEAVQAFLTKHVPAPAPDSLVPGLPDFTSLQDLLTELQAETNLPGGAVFDVLAGSYDTTSGHQKVSFTLKVTRDAGATAEPLNPAGAPTTGTASYTNTQVTGASTHFDALAGLVGRQIVVGQSAAIIKSVVSDTVLELDPAPLGNPTPDVRWQGGKPADGTTFSILANDPKIGLVELGNALKSSGAIANANAVSAVATVKPSFSLQMPIVLDLQPKNITDCDPGPGTAACPFKQTDPVSGISRIISSLPLAADRIMLRGPAGAGTTPLLVADAPISTQVAVDATVGFVGVKLTGTLTECTKNSAADCSGSTVSGKHLLTVGLKHLPGADAAGDLPFTELMSALADAMKNNTVGDLVDFSSDAQAYAALSVSVPGAPDFFGGAASATATVTLDDITDLGPSSLHVSAPQLPNLASLDIDPANPLALFGGVLGVLQALQGVMGAFPGAGQLDKPIPVVGKSFNELISAGAGGSGPGVMWSTPGAPNTSKLHDPAMAFTTAFIGRKVHVGSQESSIVDVDVADHSVLLKPALSPLPADGTAYTLDSELQGVINLLQNAPSANLQDLLNLLADKLGGGSAATFAIEPGTGGDPDTLRLNVDWKRDLTNKTPVKLNFDLGGDRSLIGAAGSGDLTVNATGRVRLTLRLPMTAAAVADPLANVTVDPTTSSVKAGVSINGDGLRFDANLGPFKASLGKPAPAAAGTQLQAGLGVTLASSDTTPQALGDFVSGLDVSVDGDGVSCPGADSGTVKLAVCAVLPTYINGTYAGSTPTTGNFVLRLPVGGDLADTFDLTGGNVNGHPRFEVPDNLAATLASAALNLLSFQDGLFGYLQFVENTMRTASFDGKLPLIGKDLQAGSDFVGGLRQDIETAFDGVDPLATNAGQIRTFLKTKVAPALPALGNPTIDITCTTGLAAPGAPNPTEAGSADGTDYRFKVVAYTPVGGENTDGKPSPASSVISSAATLDGTNHITMTWASVPHAAGYKVLVSVDGGAYHLLKDVGNVTTYDADGSDTAAAAEYVEAAGDPCSDSIPADEVTGFTFSIDMGQGDPSSAQGCEDSTDTDLAPADRPCLGADVPLDLGIPGLSLKATDATDPVHASLGWRLHLKVGLDRNNGFYVSTQDKNAPEFVVGAALDIGTTEARVAFINVTEHNNGDKKEFKGAFQIDLRDSKTADDCTASCTAKSGPKLTLDKLTSASSVGDLVKVKLSADVDIDWALRATVGSGLPGISTDFILTWGWTSDAPTDIGNLHIAFDNVALDAGEFISGALKDIVAQVVDVFKPVQPIIDTIFAPIPVISDLSQAVGGDEVTIATLAQAFSTLAGGPDIQPFLDVLKNVRDLLKALNGATCDPNPSPCLNIGSFDIVGAKAITTDANPATAQGLMTNVSKNDNLESEVNAKTGNKLSNTAADSAHPGFEFTALKHPESLLGVLVGQDVELVSFDSGPLTLGFQFQKSFGPVYAPPPVNVVIGGGASVSLRIAAGFDTYGIRTAIESGKVDAKILDSLYFKTTDSNGKPIPVVQFEGFLQAGASVSAVIIEVGIVGGIKLTVGFFWNDPNNDGKFRFGEFLATALRNPICLFNVGGELSLFIKVFITLGIDPFSVSFDFTLVSIKLLDFSLKPNCEPPPPRLGGTKDGVLYLFAGKFSGSGERGDSAWQSNNNSDESWVVRQMPAKDGEHASVVVQALGITETFDDGTDGTAISAVVLDSRNYDGKLQALFTGGTKDSPFTKKAVVAGGNKDDVFRTGQGRSYVDGGGGDDQITTLDRPDLSVPIDAPKAWVSGGAGADALTVGNAAGDVVLGDQPLTFHDSTVQVHPLEGGDVTLTGVVDPGNIDLPSNKDGAGTNPGNDQLSAGIGGVEIYGNGGDDKLGTGNDNPQAELPSIKGTPAEALYRAHSNTLVGGPGGDRIKSGSAADTIFTGTQTVIDGDGVGTGDDATLVGGRTKDQNSVDTGEGNDTVYGSNASDFVITHSTAGQHATAFGGDSEDVLVGGLGTDKLYGGPGDDYLVAQPATVSDDKPLTDVLGTARRVTLLAPGGVSSAKTLVGGGGKDRIYGASGPATIFGDHEVDACVLQSDPISKQPPQHPTDTGPVSNQDDSDLILGGDGVDTVQAGGGDDHVYTFGNNDVICANAGADEVYGGDGADLAYGGSGADRLYGDAGADQLYGNLGDDALYGGADGDRIEGNDGSDRAFGGTGNDLVVGGTSKAAEPDEGDLLYGDEGADVLVGDNADANTYPAYPTDLANTDVAPTTGGKDTVFGGSGDDRAYGGLDADNVYGGDDNDDLEGNNGGDHVYGEAGSDDIIGGSSQLAGAGTGRPDGDDQLSGGGGDDVITGDNAVLTRVGAGLGSVVTRGRAAVGERVIVLLDLGHGAAPGLFGDDTISGGDANDVILAERGQDSVHGDAGDDYAEGGQASDTIDGDAGEDDLVGGSFVADSGSGQSTVGQLDSGDTIRGGDGGDTVLGDNGVVSRVAPFSPLTQGRGPAARAVTAYDLGDNPVDGALTSGNDYIEGNGGEDVVLAEGGNDRVLAGDASDYVEGGQARDWLEGGEGSDDLVGGSSAINGADSGAAAKGQPDGADVVWGQGGDDLVAGDNAVLTRVAPFDPLTVRVGTGTAKIEPRSLRLLDRSNGGLLNPPDAIRFGADLISGQAGVDVLLGQDGADVISGGGDDDYVEGQGGADTVYGDAALSPVPAEPTGLRGSASPGFALDSAPEGQDDLLGGSSTQGFRDTSDVIHGNGSSDFVLGDNGTVKRDILGSGAGPFTDRVYTKRYGPVAADRAKVRIAGTGTSTRFCATGNGGLCEPAAASGGDQLFGEGGDDFIYGQDGNDTIHGDSGDDDIYGELGDDLLFGDAGDDAILGDRGGIRDVYETGDRSVNVSQNPPPRIDYTSRRAGSVSREVDLLHEVNGDDFSAGSTAPAILYDGVASGGNDRIRGGTGRDNLHGGVGDDLLNGDSGGDTVLGDDGADVLWGGKGCWTSSADTGPDCVTPSSRGTDDRFVDYLFGGKGATSGPSVAGGGLGADVLDWRPRGAYSTCTTNPWPTTIGTQTADPCAWFEMTDMANAPAEDDQHHQGIDWMYGGWDRDVMQGDVTENGPNDGDKMLDWDGAYNLYSHCNSAYGGYNDVRQHSPAMQDFLQKWGFGVGLGQAVGDITTDGTSAFDELALTYNQDGKDHGNGKAFPSTPGHFDDPNACSS